MEAIDPKLAAALAGLAERAAAAHEAWWVIGSAAVALHGGATEVADLDLLMMPDDARRLLQEAGLPAAPGATSALFRSELFGTIAGAALPIEVMGGLRVRGPGGWEAVTPATREPVRIGEAVLWVPSRGELIALLRRFGRAKDLARAALLEALPPR